MNVRFTRFALAVALTWLLRLPCLADETAEGLLKKAETATQAVSTLTAEYTMALSDSSGPGYGHTSTVKLARPNFYRIDVRTNSLDKNTGKWTAADLFTLDSDGKTRWWYSYRSTNYEKASIDKDGKELNLWDIQPLGDFFDPSLSGWNQLQKIRKAGRLRSLTLAGKETWEGTTYQLVDLEYVSENVYTEEQRKAFPGGVKLWKDRFYIGADNLVHRLIRSDNTNISFDYQFHNLQVGAALTPLDFAYMPPPNAKLIAPDPPLLSPGTTAPEFTAATQGGKTLKLSDYRGKIVVLDFWATWCHPCQKALPHLSRVQQAVKGQVVVFLALCVWDDRNEYDSWLSHYQARYPFIYGFDPSGKATRDSIACKLYNVNAIPVTYVLDRDGKIAACLEGYDEGETRLETALRKLQIKVLDQKEEPKAR